jgi:hypothetical protein
VDWRFRSQHLFDAFCRHGPRTKTVSLFACRIDWVTAGGRNSNGKSESPGTSDLIGSLNPANLPSSSRASRPSFASFKRNLKAKSLPRRPRRGLLLPPQKKRTRRSRLPKNQRSDKIIVVFRVLFSLNVKISNKSFGSVRNKRNYAFLSFINTV